MSDSTRTAEDVRELLQSRRACDQEKLRPFFDEWAANYEKDLDTLGYRAPALTAELISSNFSGNREEAQVLDVACGPGQFPKVMSELGFRHFVGIDYSKGMLEEAAKTGLYEDLKLVKLGTDPMPAQADTFDVVGMIGALQPDLIPFTIFRELCLVTKPGGLICFTKTHHKTDPEGFTATLERELQLLEEEGLWTCVEIKCDRYIKDTSMIEREDSQNDGFISGNLYLFKKPLK